MNKKIKPLIAAMTLQEVTSGCALRGFSFFSGGYAMRIVYVGKFRDLMRWLRSMTSEALHE
jgi:hypothetical protein